MFLVRRSAVWSVIPALVLTDVQENQNPEMRHMGWDETGQKWWQRVPFGRFKFLFKGLMSNEG